jgi:hypothetical protein
MTKKTAQSLPPLDRSGWQLGDRPLLLATLAVAAIYFAYAQLADGFYQQDEAAHFVSMRGFWYKPESVLSNWAKPGYKLVYAFPALLGSEFVTLFNALVSAAACWLAYRIAQALGSQIPLLAFVAAATQPLWVNLAFRNYSELLTATLLAGGVYAQLREKRVVAALCLSYVVFIRQEFYPIVALYGLWLLSQKNWLAAVSLAVFPLVQHFWGFAVTGEPLYLLKQILSSSSEIAAAYKRQGFDHYFKMSLTIYGAATVLLLLAYFAGIFARKAESRFQKSDFFVALPFVLYFLMHSIFNLQSFEIGPAGGGNLRYLLVVSPLAAVLAALAVEQFVGKNYVWAVLGIFVLITATMLTYQHNYIFLLPEQGRDWKPLWAVVGGLLVLAVPMTLRQRALGMAALMAVMALVTVKPIRRSDEDKACRRMVEWYKVYEKNLGQRPLLLHHDMFFYFLGRTRYEFTPLPQHINEENLAKAPKGALILWDSHYSYRPELRPGSLTYEYFTQRPQQYRLIEQVISDDQTFGFIIFEKL